ncbi:MAG: hypothetical protein V3T53_13740 [Phycisphaerales bacterium]
MGLEGIELVMEFEDEFGLQIPDDVAEKMPSVRDVVEYVHAELSRTLPQAEACLTSGSFYRLRRELVKLVSLPRRDITPKAELGSLIPQDQRRDVWQALLSCGIQLPLLQRSSATVWTAVIIVTACASGLAVVTREPWFLLAALPLWFVASLATRPLAVFVPDSAQTISDLVMYTTSMKTSDLTDAVPTRREILYKIRVITSEQLGIPIERISEDSRFTEDLHIS